MAAVIYTDNQGYRAYLEDVERNYAGEMILAFTDDRGGATAFVDVEEAKLYLAQILDERSDMKGELFVLDLDGKDTLWKKYDDAMKGVV